MNRALYLILLTVVVLSEQPFAHGLEDLATEADYAVLGAEQCNVGGTTKVARTCGTSHPLINYPADAGSCSRGKNSVSFSIWGCEITCVYSPPAGSNRKGAKCKCTVNVASCPPELDVSDIPPALL